MIMMTMIQKNVKHYPKTQNLTVFDTKSWMMMIIMILSSMSFHQNNETNDVCVVLVQASSPSSGGNGRRGGHGSSSSSSGSSGYYYNNNVREEDRYNDADDAAKRTRRWGEDIDYLSSIQAGFNTNNLWDDSALTQRSGASIEDGQQQQQGMGDEGFVEQQDGPGGDPASEGMYGSRGYYYDPSQIHEEQQQQQFGENDVYGYVQKRVETGGSGGSMGVDYNFSEGDEGSDGTRPPPPPPPSSSMSQVERDTAGIPLRVSSTSESTTSSTTILPPIHYKFHAVEPEKLRGETAVRKRHELGQEVQEGEEDEIPKTLLEEEDTSSRRRIRIEKESQLVKDEFYSPRDDAITRYMSTKRGTAMVTLSSGLVGMGFGAFLGKSIINSPTQLAIMFFALFVTLTTIRGPYGELSRALGLALIYTLQRTSNVRRKYPTLRHVKAALQAGPRRPFPPITYGNDNPWKYEPEYVDDPEFRMIQTIVAMSFVGAICGGNLPIIPTWLGALAGAVFFAYTTTLRSARGDLARSMGMRVAALAGEIININAELELMSKTATVGGRILDKLLILDRKHRIKDRIMIVLRWLYDRVTRTAAQVQADMQGRTREEEEQKEADLGGGLFGENIGTRREGRPAPRGFRDDNDRRREDFLPPRRPPRDYDRARSSDLPRRR